MTQPFVARARLLLIIVLAIASSFLSTPVHAQFGRSGGGRGGMRGPAVEKGVVVSRPINVINLLIVQRQNLALSDSQFAQVIKLKRALDSTNAPHMRELDAIEHDFRGGKAIFSAPSAARRDSIARAQFEARDAIAAIESNNASARDKAYELLSEPQLVKAKEIEAKALKAKADEESGSRGSKP